MSSENSETPQFTELPVVPPENVVVPPESLDIVSETPIGNNEKTKKKKRKHKKNNENTSSITSSSTSSFDTQLSRLTEHFGNTIKELKREYKNLDLEDKMDRMFALFYVDYCDPKSIVNDTFAAKLKEYNNSHQLAFLHTMAEIDSHINDIYDLIDPDVSDSDVSDLDDDRSDARKENDRRRR